MTMTSNILSGTPVVPGVVYGPAARITNEIPLSAVDAYRRRPPGDPEELLLAYDSAVARVAESLHTRSANASGSAAEVLVATAGLVRDKGLRHAVHKRLEAREPLLTAVSGAVEEFTVLFTKMGGLMAERVTDLEDIERRITARIVGVAEPGLVLPAEPSVLVAEDLAPADTAGLDPGRILALVTERGGPTSHTAIIARQLGLPCIVAASGVTSVPDGTRLLVDGTSGTIESEPDATHANRRVAQGRAWRERLATWCGPARTADGAPVKLLANVADGRSARAAAPKPVEGVGLFRTELCFLSRETEPDVEIQAAIYAEVLAAFDTGRTVVIRTLDAGSDKPIPYATSAGEDNPALGVRGLRLSFANSGLLERQLDAVALAAATTGTSPWVMAPMVATVDEAAGFAAEVRSRGLTAGIMVETPAAALLADRILDVVDFVSIGTNDLTQYAMAADRLAADLAHLTDPWQPAVLRLVAMTAEAGRRLGKPVGVCGEAAADPLLACVLVGLGVTSLSMAPAAVPSVGVQVESVTAEQCRAAAENVMRAVDPQEARELARAVLAPA
ncbi:phosphoenolpyruvate--protein phosphotransferase [Streptomyces sp. TLI_55]|nr:phosphoenolpyruvate--protein phosphotransferase [Streptomyces sp. TLI_55]